MSKDLTQLLTLLKTSAETERYFEVDSQGAKVLLDAIVFSSVHNGNLAAALAHRACGSTEHDPQQGKLHGCCVVCLVPWPCETAQAFMRKPSLPGNPEIWVADERKLSK